MTKQSLQKLILLNLISVGTVSAIAEQPDQSRRIAQLVRQLDADAFRTRESAHRQLVEIGLPAMGAIRKAARSKSIEVRYRAQIILGQLMSLKIRGVWQSDGQVLIIQGNHWWWGSIDHLQPAEYDKNSFRIVNVGDESFEADLLVGLGRRKGKTCKALFQLEGDTLHYSGSYKARPTGLKNGTGFEVQWKRLADSPHQGALLHRSIEIAELVHQLDDNSFRIREQASRQLLRIGEPTLEFLRAATRHLSTNVRLVRNNKWLLPLADNKSALFPHPRTSVTATAQNR